MSIFSEGFKLIIRQPLFNLLMFFYVFVTGHDLGLSIILLTILIMLLLWPLQKKAMKAQMVLQELQPKMKEIEARHKGDKQKLGEELSKLYKSQEVNPFAGILIVFLQLPIFLAMYRMFADVFSSANMSLLYGFLPKPAVIRTSFLGLVDLTKPNIVLVVIVAILQFIQIRLSLASQQKIAGAKKMMGQKMTGYVTSIIIIIFLFFWPSALALYMIVYTIFGIIQQRIFKKQLSEKYGPKGITEKNPKTS